MIIGTEGEERLIVGADVPLRVERSYEREVGLVVLSRVRIHRSRNAMNESNEATASVFQKPCLVPNSKW